MSHCCCSSGCALPLLFERVCVPSALLEHRCERLFRRPLLLKHAPCVHCRQYRQWRRLPTITAHTTLTIAAKGAAAPHDAAR